MDTTLELRARIARVRLVVGHQVRLAEHIVFDRLLYKNRSQHRRAPYFRRLEHIRRCLRAITGHVAWKSMLQHAQDNVIAFSTITLGDLEAVEIRLHELNDCTIPVAARSIVLELICRGYFLPFSIAAMSAIARIRVIESRLQQELVAVISEMRALLAIDLAASQTEMTEDIGEPVLASDEAREQRILRACKSSQSTSPVSHAPEDSTKAHSFFASIHEIDPTYPISNNGHLSSSPQNQPSKSLYELLGVDECNDGLAESFGDRAMCRNKIALVPSLSFDSPSHALGQIAPESPTKELRRDTEFAVMHQSSESVCKMDEDGAFAQNRSNSPGNIDAARSIDDKILTLQQNISTESSRTEAAKAHLTQNNKRVNDDDIDDIFAALD